LDAVSLQWEPEWEETVVEYSGMRLRVLRDKVTGLYACPICGTGDRATYLFTPKDLVYHIYAHARKTERHHARVEYTIEAEEEEE
jgi:hypothetical protein